MATGGLCVCVCVCEGRIHTPKDCHILFLNPCIFLFSVVISGHKQLVTRTCRAAQVTGFTKIHSERCKDFFLSCSKFWVIHKLSV